MLHHFETPAISRPKHSGGPPSSDPLDHQLALDDLAMLAFAAVAAVGAVVLLALGF